MANPLFSFDPITPRVAQINGQVTQAYRDLLASLKNLGRTADTWSGVAPDGSPLIVRDVGSAEIYALDWQLP